VALHSGKHTSDHHRKDILCPRIANAVGATDAAGAAVREVLEKKRRMRERERERERE
jgi:hypothetical protein